MEIIERTTIGPELPIDSADLRQLFRHLEHDAPDSLPLWRWLTFGPRFAGLAAFEGLVRQPTQGELGGLRTLMDVAPSPVESAGRQLIDLRSEVLADLDRSLAELIAADPASWTWPGQILSRPHPGFEELLDSCVDRLKKARGKRRSRLEGVREKLQLAVRISETARRRRERWFGKSA